jgi:hypothetical protein
MQVQATFTDYKNVIKLVNFINENGVFSQYTQYENIFDDIKEIYSHYSGGGFDHLMIHLHNRHIIIYDYASHTLEYSADAWDSITDYINSPVRMIGDQQHDDGFGFEAEKDDYEEGKRFVTVDIDKYLLGE